MLYHFAITEPFELNWKYVVPKDFDTLEIYLKPGLSVELGNIANGPKKFSIGAYLTNGNNRNKFNHELLPARSDERVEVAFQKEEVSCFFSADDAEALRKLFEEEKFTCRSVSVKSREHGDDLFALPIDEFNLVMDFFSEAHVRQVADIKESRVLFEGLRNEAVKEVRDEVRREQRARVTGRAPKDNKKLKIVSAIGGTALTLAGITKFASKGLFKKGLLGMAAAVGLNILSTALGLVGVRLLASAAELYTEGMF